MAGFTSPRAHRFPVRCGLASRSRARLRGGAGYTFVELLVALTILAALAPFVLQAYIASTGHAGRTNEQVAAMAVASQVMEQIQASPNPYALVGFTGLVRTAFPLPAPYQNIVNSSPYAFQVAVVVAVNNNLTITTATVQVFRPADITPYVTLGTILDDL